VDVEALQLAHFRRQARHVDTLRPGWRDFAEVNRGIGLESALEEAARCFNCGVCNDCEVCLVFCPDVAIVRRPDGGLEIDLDHCKGCGVCAEECPRGAIVMTREGL
jgi:2-oxoacid:acceptor oxidoreductase delta subunit (pyruvate/2-ketoisovalerate family)